MAFEDAKTAFWDPLSLTVQDPAHSADEERLVLLGLSLRGRLLYVVHRDLGDRIRIISARRATKKEAKDYEEKSKKKPSLEMPELSFRGGVRGKYVHRLPEMNRTITLAADLVEVFPDSASANVALRKIASIIRSHDLRGHAVGSVG